MKYFAKKISNIKPFFYFLLQKDFKEATKLKWSVLHSRNFTLSEDLINGKNIIEYVVETTPNFKDNSHYTHLNGELLLTYKESANECLQCFIERISNLSICEKSTFCFEGKNYLIYNANISKLIPIAEEDGYVVYQGRYDIKICEIVARKD